MKLIKQNLCYTSARARSGENKQKKIGKRKAWNNKRSKCQGREKIKLRESEKKKENTRGDQFIEQKKLAKGELEICRNEKKTLL